jgi:hypothetical protein
MSAINLYTTKTQALYFKDSQRNSFYDFGGIQLLPNYGNDYIEKFNYSSTSFTSVGAYKVSDDSLKSNMITNVSLYTSPLSIKYLFLSNLPELGNDLIYLKLVDNFSNTYYSNPFYITSLDEYRTTYIEYYDNYNEYSTEGSPAQSTQLKFWFRQKSRQSELTTYYESSTKNTVTQAIKTHNLEMYESEFMSIEDLIMTAEILEKPYLFIDGKRCSLFEAVKIPELTQQENFGKIKFTLAPNN